MKLLRKDLEIIQNAIGEAEKRTSGEIVVAILTKSDDYLHIDFIIASIFSFIGIAIASYNRDLYFSPFAASIIFWLIGFLLIKIPMVKSIFLTRNNKDAEVKQKAFQIFFEKGIHRTIGSTGILIFVSLLERKIEIIADKGINDKVENSFWDSHMENILFSIKKNNISTGIATAINEFTNVLEKEFPIQVDDTNEISNQVITDLVI